MLVSCETPYVREIHGDYAIVHVHNERIRLKAERDRIHEEMYNSPEYSFELEQRLDTINRMITALSIFYHANLNTVPLRGLVRVLKPSPFSKDATIHKVQCDTFIVGGDPSETYLIDIEQELNRLVKLESDIKSEMERLSYFTKAIPESLARTQDYIKRLEHYRSLGMRYVSHETFTSKS